MKTKLETVEEFLKRGGKVKKLPEEMEWPILPLQEQTKLIKTVETLDYERDHKPTRY